MPSEVIVMPSWQADRYSSIRSICLSTSAAPRRPSSRSCSTRPCEARTSANSAATKSPFSGDQHGDAEQEQELGHSDRVLGGQGLEALALPTSRGIVVAHAVTRRV